MTHLEREIRSQPIVLERLLRREALRIGRIARLLGARPPRAMFIVARGSSDNAGIYGKYLFGARNRLLVALATPSLFTIYRHPPDLSGCLVLAISQSGVSEDIRQVVAEANRQGALTLAFTNTPNSPLAQEAQHVICLHAGVERSVAATKTFSATLMALAIFSVALRGNHFRELDLLKRVPGAVERLLQKEPQFGAAALAQPDFQRISVIGRGYNYATAFEIALKLKELAYVTAEPYSSADFRHGPIAMAGCNFPVMMIAPRGKTLGDLVALAQTLHARRSSLLICSTSRKLRALADTILPAVDTLPEWLSPLCFAVSGQLFVSHLARTRGCALDHPRWLSKVTNTR